MLTITNDGMAGLVLIAKERKTMDNIAKVI